MNITITGNLGAGKTTVRDELKKLGYDTLSGGDVFRRVAQEKGVSVVELNEMIKGDPSIDDEIDGMTAKLGKEADHTVFDFRLGWHFVPDSFKVFLLVDPDVAAERVFSGTARDAESYQSFEEAAEALKKRAKAEQERFADLYGINYYDAANYDFIIESSYASPEEITREIVRGLKLYEAGKTERRIELGIPGLYPTRRYGELDIARLREYQAQEKASDSLCVLSPAEATMKAGHCYLLGGHHRVFAGASVGKRFAEVRLDLSMAARRRVELLDTEELRDYENVGGFRYRGGNTPREGFLLSF